MFHVVDVIKSNQQWEHFYGGKVAFPTFRHFYFHFFPSLLLLLLLFVKSSFSNKMAHID